MPSYGVIFDMDGVLIDSYQAHYQSWCTMLARHGLSMSQQQFAASFGRTSREVIASYWSGQVPEEAIPAMDAEKEAGFREILAAHFPEMPGAGSLLDALAAEGIAIGLGSSAPPENVDLVLHELGRRDRFAAIVTGRDVHRGKPDPQVFLLAAQRLRLSPHRCCVVEDAPLGVAAAHAAGAACVGLVSTGRTAAQLAQADRVVDRLEDLSPSIFRALVDGAQHDRMS